MWVAMCAAAHESDMIRAGFSATAYPCCRSPGSRLTDLTDYSRPLCLAHHMPSRRVIWLCYADITHRASESCCQCARRDVQRCILPEPEGKIISSTFSY